METKLLMQAKELRVLQKKVMDVTILLDTFRKKNKDGELTPLINAAEESLNKSYDNIDVIVEVLLEKNNTPRGKLV